MQKQEKTVALIGVPLEEGSGRGGCAMGPAAYRIAGIASALGELGYAVEDRGDLRPQPAADLAEGQSPRSREAEQHQHLEPGEGEAERLEDSVDA